MYMSWLYWKVAGKKLDMCLETRMPPAATKSYILTPPHPKGHVMSVKCEELIDELTVQVGYGVIIQTLNIALCGTELRTDRQMDDPITRCPRRTFKAGA